MFIYFIASLPLIWYFIYTYIKNQKQQLPKKYSEKKIDFLDIDAEGADLDVLESLDFSKYSPELICVEYIGKDKKDSNIFKFLINNGYENIWSGVFSHLFKRNQGV